MSSKHITDILIQRAYHSMLRYGERQHRSPQLGARDAAVERATPPKESRQVRRAKERAAKR